MRKNPMLALVSNPAMRARKRPLSLAERKRRREAVKRAMAHNASDEFHQRKHAEAIKESSRLERLAGDQHISPDARHDYLHSSTLRRGEAQAHYDSLIEPIKERGAAYLRLKRKILARQGMGGNPHGMEDAPEWMKSGDPGSGPFDVVEWISPPNNVKLIKSFMDYRKAQEYAEYMSHKFGRVYKLVGPKGVMFMASSPDPRIRRERAQETFEVMQKHPVFKSDPLGEEELRTMSSRKGTLDAWQVDLIKIGDEVEFINPVLRLRDVLEVSNIKTSKGEKYITGISDWNGQEWCVPGSLLLRKSKLKVRRNPYSRTRISSRQGMGENPSRKVRVWTKDAFGRKEGGNYTIMTDWISESQAKRFIIGRWGHWPPFAFISAAKDSDAFRRVYGENPYSRTRISSPREFDPRSFRTITPGSGKHKMVVGCPTGHYKHGRCDVGMEVQSVMRRRNPFMLKGPFCLVRDNKRLPGEYNEYQVALREAHRMLGDAISYVSIHDEGCAHPIAVKTLWSSKQGERSRNPGAAWHDRAARQYALDAKYLPRTRAQQQEWELLAEHERAAARTSRAYGINPRGDPRSIDDTELHTWFERDRAHVGLRDKQSGKTLIEWWDDDVHQAVEDGILDTRGFVMGREVNKGPLHLSAYNYWVEMQGGHRRNPDIPRSRAYSRGLQDAIAGRPPEDLSGLPADVAEAYREGYADAPARQKADKTRWILPRGGRRNPGVGLSADDRARALKIKGVKPEMLDDPKFVSALAKHIEFHGEWPTDLTQREIKGIGDPNQVEYLVNMGKALDISYKPAPGQKSNKAGSAWLHEFNEGKEDMAKLPDRLCTGDGKTIITHGGKYAVKDWVRG